MAARSRPGGGEWLETIVTQPLGTCGGWELFTATQDSSASWWVHHTTAQTPPGLRRAPGKCRVPWLHEFAGIPRWSLGVSWAAGESCPAEMWRGCRRSSWGGRAGDSGARQGCGGPFSLCWCRTHAPHPRRGTQGWPGPWGWSVVVVDDCKDYLNHLRDHVSHRLYPL